MERQIIGILFQIFFIHPTASLTAAATCNLLQPTRQSCQIISLERMVCTGYRLVRGEFRLHSVYNFITKFYVY